MKKILFGVAALGILGLAGAGIGLKAQDTVEAKAEAATTPTTIYVKTSGCSFWSKDSAATFVRAWGDDKAATWISTSVVDAESELLSFVLPTGYSGFFVGRLNPTNTASSNPTGWVASEIWNQSYDVDFDGLKNYVVLNAKGDGEDKVPYTYKGRHEFASGTKFFVDASNNSGWWNTEKITIGGDTGDPYTYLTFYGEDSATYKMSRVGSSSLYYCATDSALTVEAAIVVRGLDGFDGSNWETKRKHQSVDYVFTLQNLENRSMVLSNTYNDKGNYTFDAGEENSDEFIAEAYGKYFLGLDLCKDEGGMNDDGTLWGEASATYTATLEYLTNKNYIAAHTKNVEGEKYIERALARYDSVIAKNSAVTYPNFMSRSTSGAFVAAEVKNNGELNALPIVIAISAVTLIGLGLVLAHKRRAE